MTDVDLNDIRKFAVAAQLGTLTAAAEILKVPPSTVSRFVARLEKHLGVLLIHRNHKGIVLTDAGKDYLLACRRGLRVLSDAGELLDRGRTAPHGDLKIACPLSVAHDFFAPALKEFLRRYPEIHVELEPYAFGRDQEPRSLLKKVSLFV